MSTSYPVFPYPLYLCICINQCASWLPVPCLRVLYRVQEDHPIMSFTVSKNGRLALLNVATQVSWTPPLSIYLCLKQIDALLLETLCSTFQELVCSSTTFSRECTSGTFKTECWWGSTKVWPRASTPSTPALEDTTKTSLPVAVKVQSHNENNHQSFLRFPLMYLIFVSPFLHRPQSVHLAPARRTPDCWANRTHTHR